MESQKREIQNPKITNIDYLEKMTNNKDYKDYSKIELIKEIKKLKKRKKYGIVQLW